MAKTTTTAKLNILHDKGDIMGRSKSEYKCPGRTSETKYSFRRIAEEKKRKGEEDRLFAPLSAQVTAAAKRTDNCINLFPIRHRNSRSFGLITLLKDLAATSYHPAGLRFPIKFLQEQNARPPAVHRRSLTLLNRDLHESRFVYK